MAVTTALMIVSLVVGILGAVYQVSSDAILRGMNEDVKTQVQQLANEVADQIRSGNLDANKAISLVTNRRARAAANLATQNPMIAKTLRQVYDETDNIDELASELTAANNALSEELAKAKELGYNQNVFSPEYDKLATAKDRVDAARARVTKAQHAVKNATTTDSGSSVYAKPNLSGLEQNVNGAMSAQKG